MNPIKKLFYGLAAGSVIILFLLHGPGYCSQCREPVVAGAFYPKDKDELSALIDSFTQKAQQTQIDLPGNKHSGLIEAHRALRNIDGIARPDTANIARAH